MYSYTRICQTKTGVFLLYSPKKLFPTHALDAWLRGNPTKCRPGAGAAVHLKVVMICFC